MSVNKVLDSIRSFFLDLLGKDIQVISIIPNDEGWDAEFEVIVEDEYMRKIARNEIIARYEVKVDKNLDVISYNRKELRERGSLE